MTVPLERLPGIPALARGLATGAPDVSAFLPRAAGLAGLAAQAAAVRAAFRPRTLPAGADARLVSPARGERAAVLTGQQAGLFGGRTHAVAVAAKWIAADLAAGHGRGPRSACVRDHDSWRSRASSSRRRGPKDFGEAAIAANRAPVGR